MGLLELKRGGSERKGTAGSSGKGKYINNSNIGHEQDERRKERKWGKTKMKGIVAVERSREPCWLKEGEEKTNGK